MNKILALGIIITLIVSGIVIIGFSQLLNENTQTPTNTPTPTPTATPTPTTPEPTPTSTPNDLDSIPKPSIPEFTIGIIDSSYDVPTTYSIDPYTGENVTHPGYHVEANSLEIKLKNQPFQHFMIESYSVNFHFNIRVKGHYSEDWGYPYSAYYGFIRADLGSEYTIEIIEPSMIDYPSGAQVDYQAEAMIGYIRPPLGQFGSWFLVGETSGWSETKTLTFP